VTGQIFLFVMFFDQIKNLSVYDDKARVYKYCMNDRKYTKVLIETVVERGIKDITDDPKRSLRRIAEMGKQFSEGRFQKASFGHITNLLKNDDSPYYKMLEDFLATVDHKCIKTFGLNLGYDSWTYGARVIRRESESRGYMLPWIVFIHYGMEKNKGMTAEGIRSLIGGLKPLGTNTYVLIIEHGSAADPDLMEVISENPECTFFLFLNDGEISAEEAETVKNLKNVVISVNISAAGAMATCRMLKEMKALYVIHYIYSTDETDRFADEEYIGSWLTYGSAFIFLVQKDSDKGIAGKYARNTRMEQEYPILIWDIYSDSRLINEMISDMPFIFEIGSDGNVIYPENTGINVLGRDIVSVMEEIAPPYRPLQEY